MGDLLVFAESELVYKRHELPLFGARDRGKRQGPETWFPSETMGKLIKAVTQQTVLRKLRGPARHHAILVTGHQAGGFIGDCLRNVL